MSVEFFKNNKNNIVRWRVFDIDDSKDSVDIIFCSGEFQSNGEAIQNMLSCHAIIGVFVVALAQGKDQKDNITFKKYNDEKIRWEINDGKDILATSHVGFDNHFDATNNLIITYTMLTVYISQMAHSESVIKILKP